MSRLKTVMRGKLLSWTCTTWFCSDTYLAVRPSHLLGSVREESVPSCYYLLPLDFAVALTWQCKGRGEELRQREVLQPDQLQNPRHVAQCSPGGHDDHGGHGDHRVWGGHVGQDDKHTWGIMTVHLLIIQIKLIVVIKTKSDQPTPNVVKQNLISWAKRWIWPSHPKCWGNGRDLQKLRQSSRCRDVRLKCEVTSRMRLIIRLLSSWLWSGGICKRRFTLGQ